MKKDKGVYVSSRDFKKNLLHREYQLYNNRIALGDGSTGYEVNAKDFAVQHNRKLDSVICGCKTSGLKHNHEARYVITTPGSYRSRNYLDVGVGSVRKLPKKRVRKIYLPETIETGVGSTDITKYFRRNKQQGYDHYSQKNRRTSSKCVGGIIETTSGYVVSEKLSPIAPRLTSISGYTSQSLIRSDTRKYAKILRDIDIGSKIIHSFASASIQVNKSKHEFKTAYAGNSTVNQLVAATTQVEVETKHESKSKSALRRTPTKAVLSHQVGKSKSPSLSKASKASKSPNLSKASKTSLKVPVDVRTAKILSSDAILQVHNLEINSEAKFVNTTEPPDKVNKEKSPKVSHEEQKKNIKAENVSNMSKESTAKNITGLKSTSMLKRRFDALRRTLGKKEDSNKVVKSPSIHTSDEKTSSWKTPSSHVPVSRTSSQETTSRNAPVSRTSSRKTISRDAPIPRISSQKAPSHHVLVSRTSNRKTPSYHAPVSRTSIQKTPSHHAPVPRTISQKSPSHHAPVSRTSSQKTPSHHAPVPRTSSQKTPSHTPVSRTSSRKSRMDVAIVSDPPSLVARSYSELFMEPNKLSYKHSSKKSITMEKEVSSHDASSKYNTLDSDLSQGVNGMFKLWGKKFNLEGNPDVGGIYSPSYIKSKTKVNKERFDESPAPKAKEKKRFFFFRSKPKEIKKSKKKEKAKFEENFASKPGMTTERCEVKSGFAIKLGGPHKQKSIMVKNDEPKQRRESAKSPGELLRQDWLMKFSTNPNESCYSVKLRWNNGKYVTSSSTVGGTEKAYDTDELLKSASELSMTSRRSSHFVPKIQHNINYMQLYQAWMIPRLERTILPSRSENYEGNIDVAFLNKQWFIDKSKAFADQLELILHTKNITKFNRKVSSEYITIDIPKNFFSDSSTGDNTPTHPIRLSDEEVYNIVEYETPNASEVMKKYKNTITKVDHSVQGSLVAENMEKMIIEPLQKDYKDKPKYQDMETQQSPIYDPNNVVGVITKQELKNSRKSTLRCMENKPNHYYDNLQISLTGKKCEYAESYSQEYCSGNIWTGSGNNWVSMDLFSWCISDHKFQYCSIKDSRKSLSNADCTKSCPNIQDEFVTPTFMSTCNIISSYSPYNNIQTDKITHENVKSVKFLPRKRSNKERLKELARFVPKDSLEVLKKRKIYSSRKNWASIEESTKKDRKDAKGKKHVSLEFHNMTEEILSTITSHSKNTLKRTSSLDKPFTSYSLVSDPETISTNSQKASKQSLKSSLVNTKKFSNSSSPRLSPKQSNPTISCSGLKMGVMGILSVESTQIVFSSTDCLRSSVSKTSFHEDSENSKKKSVITAQSQQNNPVSSVLKLSNSQSLPLVVIESFESVASKCFENEETSKTSLDNGESKCGEIQIYERNDASNHIVSKEGKIKEACKNVEDSLALQCKIIKSTRKDDFNNANTTIDDNNKLLQLNEMISNVNDSFALKFNSVRELSNDQYNNTLISKENAGNNVIQNIDDIIKSNSERVKENKSHNLLISNDETMPEVVEDINDISNCKSAKISSKDNSKNQFDSEKQITATPPESNQVAAPKYSTTKSILSKTTMHSQKTSAASLCRKTSGGTSIRNMLSMEQNVLYESHKNHKISDCNASIKTQHEDVVHINSHEKITVKVKNRKSSTEEIAQSKHESGRGTHESFSEIKHEVYHSKESIHNRNTLSANTDKDTFKTYNIKKISDDKNNLLNKNETSIANIIEIDFKLKVIEGDQSTEVHIGNEGNMANKINLKQASQDILVMNENEQKYPISDFVTKDANVEKDINIKIMIKNFKSKTNSGISERPHNTNKDYTDFANEISEKFQTVAAPATSDIYSTHKATVNLTTSCKSVESIKLNNDISHHVSDIIMLSNVNKSDSAVDMSDIKSAKETRRKKMSIFGKITSRTKEKFAKGHGKVSKCSESDTLASENDVDPENCTNVSSKTSNKSKSIKSIYRRAIGHKPNKKVDENMIKLSEEFPSEYVSQSQSKYQVKKELLKKVFETENCFGNRKTKSRVRKLKSILKSILTSDSDTDLSLVRQGLIKDFTDASLSLEKSSYTSLTSVLNNIDDYKKCCNKRKNASSTDIASEKDNALDSDEKSPKGYIFSTIADRLNMCGAFGTAGCCCSRPETKHEETSCNLAKEERHSQQKSKVASLVDVETQNSLEYVVSKLKNMSKHVYSNHQSIAHVAIVEDEFNNKTMRETFEPLAKLALNLETEIIKEKAITTKDNKAPVVKSFDNENENKIESSEVDNKKVMAISENNDLLDESNTEEINVTHKMKTATRRASTDSKKIVITIDNFKRKCEEPKIVIKDGKKTFVPKSNRVKPCDFKKIDRNTKLGISDDDKIIFLEAESTKVSQRHKHKHRKREETNERPLVGSDILQMYETKKAVLQIYAEKRRMANGEKFVANLPVFMVNQESEIYRNYGDLVKYAYCSIRKNVML